MRNRALGAVVLSMALVGTVRAQDAQFVLADVARAMGAAELKSIRYVGNGFSFAFGQNYATDEPWPRFRMEHYDRLVNYEEVASREEIVRTQAESPARGGGNQPMVGIQSQIFSMGQDAAWNEASTLAAVPAGDSGGGPIPAVGAGATPAPEAVAERKLQIWMTPQGFVKAALTHNVTLSHQTQRRRQLTLLSFTLEDGTPVTGTINDQNQVERVEARVPNPVLGDMLVQNNYLNYRDFNGVSFPSQILVYQGGYETLEVLVTDVVANPSDRLIAPPQARQAKVEPPRVEVQPVAEGIWFLTGGSHNSVAVEFRDYVAVIEAPLDEARSMAVIGEVHRLAPGKQIRYVINTHHHFDAAGGLRAYVAEGATVITHESNRRFYDLVFEAERTLYPDRLSQSGEHARLETLTDHYLLSNGGRVLEIHLVEGNQHSGDLLMVYLPRERLLVEADAFTPGEPGAAPPATPNPFAVNLYENVQRLKLDVTQIAPIHGRIVPWSEFLKAIGKQSPAEPDGMLHAALLPPRWPAQVHHH
jgi:glyoxylase-like metal-dependent hydrolase (beta-lactamase superfamily II)